MHSGADSSSPEIAASIPPPLPGPHARFWGRSRSCSSGDTGRPVDRNSVSGLRSVTAGVQRLQSSNLCGAYIANPGIWDQVAHSVSLSLPGCASRPHASSPVVASAQLRSSLDEGLPRAGTWWARGDRCKRRTERKWVDGEEAVVSGSAPVTHRTACQTGQWPGAREGLARAPTSTVSSTRRRVTTQLPHQSEGSVANPRRPFRLHPYLDRHPEAKARPGVVSGPRPCSTALACGPSAFFSTQSRGSRVHLPRLCRSHPPRDIGRRWGRAGSLTAGCGCWSSPSRFPTPPYSPGLLFSDQQASRGWPGSRATCSLCQALRPSGLRLPHGSHRPQFRGAPSAGQRSPHGPGTSGDGFFPSRPRTPRAVRRGFPGP